MAEDLPEPASDEVTFRNQSKWLAFKGSLYSALSGAAFIGILSQMVTMGVAAAAGTLAAPAAPVVAFMGASLAVGAVFTYMAQNKWTELKYIQDEHLARRNAEFMGKGHGHVRVQEVDPNTIVVEHECNERNDGKKWSNVVAQDRSRQSIKETSPQIS